MVSGLSEAQAAVTYQITADASPATILPGQTVQFSGSATASANEPNFSILFVLRHGNGIVTQQSFPGINFVAGQAVKESFSWTAPTTNPSFGTYTLVVRVLNAKGSGVGHNTDTFQLIRPPVNGMCGSSGGATLTLKPATGTLCSTGTASSISGTGPWNWTCKGTNGGTNTTCTAQKATTTPPPVNGLCGSSNNLTLASVPTTNLCSTGTASTVAGTGPWSWSCNGSNGGTNASCSANFAPTSAVLFPAMGDQTSSVYPWAQYPPGVTYNGGIPARTTQCGPTLMPLGSGKDDTPQIQAAVDACPAGQHVQLGAGVFLIGDGSQNESINITNSNTWTILTQLMRYGWLNIIVNKISFFRLEFYSNF